MSGTSLICASLAASRKRVADATNASSAGSETPAALPCASLRPPKALVSGVQGKARGCERGAAHAQAVDEGQRVLRMVQRRQRLRPRRAAASRGARQRLLRALQLRRKLLLLSRRAAAQRVNGSHLRGGEGWRGVSWRVSVQRLTGAHQSVQRLGHGGCAAGVGSAQAAADTRVSRRYALGRRRKWRQRWEGSVAFGGSGGQSGCETLPNDGGRRERVDEQRWLRHDGAWRRVEQPR